MSQSIQRLTLGEFRRATAGLPDDLPISISTEDDPRVGKRGAPGISYGMSTFAHKVEEKQYGDLSCAEVRVILYSWNDPPPDRPLDMHPNDARNFPDRS